MEGESTICSKNIYASSEKFTHIHKKACTDIFTTKAVDKIALKVCALVPSFQGKTKQWRELSIWSLRGITTSFNHIKFLTFKY